MGGENEACARNVFLDAGRRQRPDEALAAPFLEIRIGCL